MAPRTAPRYSSWVRDTGWGQVAELRLELHRCPAVVRLASSSRGSVWLTLEQSSVRLDGVDEGTELPEGPLWLCDASCDGDQVHLVVEGGDGRCQVLVGRRLSVAR